VHSRSSKQKNISNKFISQTWHEIPKLKEREGERERGREGVPQIMY